MRLASSSSGMFLGARVLASGTALTGPGSHFFQEFF